MHNTKTSFPNLDSPTCCLHVYQLALSSTHFFDIRQARLSDSPPLSTHPLLFSSNNMPPRKNKDAAAAAAAAQVADGAEAENGTPSGKGKEKDKSRENNEEGISIEVCPFRLSRAVIP